jgi:hypothetical protein
MNNDYLWDGSGEPDPEIQQLEQVLGALRYESRPLEIPAQMQIGRKRFPFLSYALAAAIVLMLFTAGLWLVWHNQSTANSTAIGTTPVVNDSSPLPVASPNTDREGSSISSTGSDGTSQQKSLQRLIEPRHRNRIPRNLLAGNTTRRRVKTPELTRNERAEVETAKQQLFLALRVASSKLNLAQKKAQGTYPGNPIRNQHKVG